MSKNPELDYFMNEEKSDVLFVVEGQTIPALKSFLSIRSKVFRAMFLGEFKESKEVVIEDTTYEAFKTFIRFLYCDHLDLKFGTDFKMIAEFYRLSDKYDVSRLENRLTDYLYSSAMMYVDGSPTSSRSAFQRIWSQMQLISKIAFEFKIEKLMDKVMEFIDKKFDHFLQQRNELLFQLNDSTDGRLFPLIVDKCTDNRFNHNSKDKLKELIDLMAKDCKHLKGLKESLKKVQSFKCDNFEKINHVESLGKYTECEECHQLFYKFN